MLSSKCPYLELWVASWVCLRNGDSYPKIHLSFPTRNNHCWWFLGGCGHHQSAHISSSQVLHSWWRLKETPTTSYTPKRIPKLKLPKRCFCWAFLEALGIPHIGYLLLKDKLIIPSWELSHLPSHKRQKLSRYCPNFSFRWDMDLHPILDWFEHEVWFPPILGSPMVNPLLCHN